jgi:hypothetical protein
LVAGVNADADSDWLLAMLGAVRREGLLDLDCTVEGSAHLAKASRKPSPCSSTSDKTRRLLGFKGRVSDSGEGRWSLQASTEEGVPARASARR